MRTARLKLPSSECVAVYHCISKTVNAAWLIDDVSKEVLRKLIYRVAEYCGVEILTFVILDNHFHILVRVPLQTPIEDAELLRRYRILYPEPTSYQPARIEVLKAMLETDGEQAQAWRKRHLALMGDVSRFMQLLKERFTNWFNKSHQRIGTLWCERFKSSLVEPRSRAVLAVAAYIDLNPVRAGIVQDPKEYRFCGYADAVSGVSSARRGLQEAVGQSGWRQAQSDYRQILFSKGVSAMKPGALEEVIGRGGKLPLGEILRCRIRYLISGAILGSEAYVRTQLVYFRQKRTPVTLPLFEAELVAMRRPRKPGFG